MVLERSFQATVIKILKETFPGCVVLKNDTSYLQGVPDLLLLVGHRWAALEVKPSAEAKRQPNQPYYIDKLDAMSFAAFVHPDNFEEVLHALQQAL